jgi:hypothetical protein
MTKTSFVIKPTGDLIREPEKPATLPIPSELIEVQVRGAYTAMDRKLWSLLLHLAWDELETKSKIGEWHEIEMLEIRRILERFTGTRDVNHIWESAERLTQTTALFQHLDKVRDTRVKTITSIFAAQTDVEAKKDGTLRFMFPAPLIPIIKEPFRFARLKLHFMLGLRSKYAVTLYELFETVANMKQPVLEMTPVQIRAWLNIPEGKLKKWNHVWDFALKPALEELNENQEIAGIKITHELQRGGRGGRVQKVTFHIEKASTRVALEQDIQIDRRNQAHPNSSALIPPFRGTIIYEKAKKKAPGLDVYVLEKEWREWVKDKNVEVRNAEALFLHFCEQRATKTRVLFPT